MNINNSSSIGDTGAREGITSIRNQEQIECQASGRVSLVPADNGFDTALRVLAFVLNGKTRAIVFPQVQSKLNAGGEPSRVVHWKHASDLDGLAV